MAFIEEKYFIRMRDVDKNNNITDKGILGLLEDIACLHSDRVGLGSKDINQTHLSWVLLNWKVQIIKRPQYGDLITVKTWSSKSSSFFSFRDFEMYNESDELIAIGTSKWVLINSDKGSIARITDDIISRYEPENKSIFNEPDISKMKEPDEYSNSISYTVKRMDIDVNKHMHNLNYLDLAYEALPEDVYENCNFTKIEIMYKTSALLGDKLKCLYSCKNNEHFISIKSESENTLYCIIKLS